MENRFAPPGVMVDDVGLASDGVQPIKLWPPRGRIGRLRFLAYSLGLYVVMIVVAFALGILGAVAHVDAALVPLVAVVFYVVGGATLLVQRSHDMNMSGWWSIGAFVPIIGLMWVFKGGTNGTNQWGAPPPPNGLMVKIFGLLMPVLFAIGLVAAIALPAYQQYAVRAGAAAPR